MGMKESETFIKQLGGGGEEMEVSLSDNFVRQVLN